MPHQVDDGPWAIDPAVDGGQRGHSTSVAGIAASRVSRLVLAILLTSALVTVFSGCLDEARFPPDGPSDGVVNDKNDTPSLAVRIAADDGPLSEGIATSSDVDYFKFDTVSSRRYWIATSGATDTVLTLFQPDGTTVIASDDDSGTGLNARLGWTSTSAGTFYFRVAGAASSVGPYSVEVVHDEVVLSTDVAQITGTMGMTYSGAAYDSTYLNHWLINSIGGYMEFSFEGPQTINFSLQGSTSSGVSHCYLDFAVNGAPYASDVFVDGGWRIMFLDASAFVIGTNTVRITLKMGPGETSVTNLWIDDVWTE